MTRFQKEISGQLGDYWQASAEQDVKEAVIDANKNAIVEDDGAIKWKSNGAYIPDDFCEKLEYAGYKFSREATAIKRAAQVHRELAQYKANYTGPSDEEVAEMRAAFGEGETIVDVITGKTIKL